MRCFWFHVVNGGLLARIECHIDNSGPLLSEKDLREVNRAATFYLQMIRRADDPITRGDYGMDNGQGRSCYYLGDGEYMTFWYETTYVESAYPRLSGYAEVRFP